MIFLVSTKECYVALHHFPDAILLHSDALKSDDSSFPVVVNLTREEMNLSNLHDIDISPTDTALASLSEGVLFPADHKFKVSTLPSIRLAQRLRETVQREIPAETLRSYPTTIEASHSMILDLKQANAEKDKVIEILRIQAAENAQRILDAESRSKELEREKSIIVSELERVSNVTPGIGRKSITSNAWHRENPSAANHLFGCGSWDNTKVLFNALFWIDTSTESNGSGPLSVFEKFLATKMRFTKKFEITTVALILNKDISWMCKICNMYSRKLGEAGEDLSILDITKEYIDYECPLEYLEAREVIGPIGALVDGKDFKTDFNRQSSALLRASYSEKSHGAAARALVWSSALGLLFEHSPLVFGRASENTIVKYMGSFSGLTPREGLRVQHIGSWEDFERMEFMDREILSTNPELPFDPNSLPVDGNGDVIEHRGDANERVTRNDEATSDNLETQQYVASIFRNNLSLSLPGLNHSFRNDFNFISPIPLTWGT